MTPLFAVLVISLPTSFGKYGHASLEGEISSLREDINSLKDEHTKALKDRDTRIKSLQETLKDRDTRIEALEKVVFQPQGVTTKLNPINNLAHQNWIDLSQNPKGGFVKRKCGILNKY